jgi:hypothetical protein
VDAVAWVAVAGIAGTLLGAIGAPVIAERMRRRSARDDRLLTERMAVYIDLIRQVSRMTDHLDIKVSDGTQTTTLEELRQAINHAIDRASVIGSTDVDNAMAGYWEAVDALAAYNPTAGPSASELLRGVVAAQAAIRDSIRAELGSDRSRRWFGRRR